MNYAFIHYHLNGWTRGKEYTWHWTAAQYRSSQSSHLTTKRSNIANMRTKRAGHCTSEIFPCGILPVQANICVKLYVCVIKSTSGIYRSLHADGVHHKPFCRNEKHSLFVCLLWPQELNISNCGIADQVTVRRCIPQDKPGVAMIVLQSNAVLSKPRRLRNKPKCVVAAIGSSCCGEENCQRLGVAIGLIRVKTIRERLRCASVWEWVKPIWVRVRVCMFLWKILCLGRTTCENSKFKKFYN